jgi:hypothetical protein
MRRALLFVLILLLTVVPAEARRHSWGLWGFFSMPHVYRHEHRHHRYAKRDTRSAVRTDRAQGHTYTTAELVPPDWQLQPTDPNLKGQRFVSTNGDGSLALFATPIQKEPIAKHMNAIAFVDGEQIMHLHAEENWIEVSGFKADHSFYRKALLACDGQVWHEVSFEYPTERRDDITKFVIRAAKAVGNSEDQGCEPPEAATAGETAPSEEVPIAPSSSSSELQVKPPEGAGQSADDQTTGTNTRAP